MMKRLEIAGFGPIREAKIDFGDLTVLVGPQATGKSLFVQLVKAISDAGAIRADLKQYGFEWHRGADPVGAYCSLYFGGGLQSLITKQTSILVDGKALPFSRVAKPGGNKDASESVLVVPAQRVLVLQDEWPKPFMAYRVGDPYCMRRFSEVLRSVMDGFADSDAAIFPQPKRLMSTLREAIDTSIYAGFELKLDHEGQRKRLVLSPGKRAAPLPFNAWSAGQREFTPLLFSMYWLMPPTKGSRRGALTHAIIEEPEMGLHPQAIVSFMLLVLALLHRGYRVTLSTHSPIVLDVIWALSNLKALKQRAAVSALRKVFDVEAAGNQINETLEAALGKSCRVYYFDRTPGGVVVRDISALDPSDEDEAVRGWGGLSGFSGRIAETVGDALARGTR